MNIISNFSFMVWTIATGAVIALSYFFIKRVFLSKKISNQKVNRILRQLNFAETLYWPIFITAICLSLIVGNMVVGIILIFFITAVFWLPLRNYFIGLVYIVGDTYEIGQLIRYNERQGTIKSFGHISLEMELTDGESLDIPYAHFADATVIRTNPISGIISHAIQVPIKKPCDLENEKQQIKAILLALPWVLPSQKIVLEQIEELKSHYLLKVIVFGIDKNHMYKVEDKLKSKYKNFVVLN